MTRGALPLAVLLCGALGAGAAHADECRAPEGPHERLDTSRSVLVLRTLPERPRIGTHFSLDVRLCAKVGQTYGSLSVDATMPEHGHGMNSRAAVTRLGPGRWRADGLMFHMPGRWRLAIEVSTSEGTERLTLEMRYE